MDNILKNNEKGEIVEGMVPVEENLEPQEEGFDINDVAPEDLDARWLRWKCLVCGYLYEGVVRLKVCPKCGNEDPDKFEDAE
jgi:rubrerythrin